MIEQIDFGNVVRRVLRQWYVILMISISVSLFAGIVSSRRYSPEYTTEALIVVYSKSASGSEVYAAQGTAEIFEEVINNNLLQKKIAEVLEISALPGRISCQGITNTNMINIRVVADSPQNAMLVMNGFLDHYDVLIGKLLDNVVLRVLEAPKVPTAPIALYNDTKILVSTFAVSVALVTIIMCLFFYLRDDIKNVNQVEKKLDTKLYATIYHENLKRGFANPFRKRKKTGLLVTNPVTGFGYIETFQKMCTKLDYQARKKDWKTIMVSSVHENEGKSTVAANLALSLAKIGKKVLLVDLDLRKPAVFKLFEVSYAKDRTQIGDVLSGKTKAQNAIRKVDKLPLYLLAGNRSYNNSTRLIVKNTAVQAIADLKDNVDYVILDTPPINLVADAEEIMGYADAGLLVVRQNVSKTKDINDAIDVFKSTRCHLLGCVYNDVETGLFRPRGLLGDSYGYGYRYSYRYGHGNRYGKEKTK